MTHFASPGVPLDAPAERVPNANRNLHPKHFQILVSQAGNDIFVLMSTIKNNGTFKFNKVSKTNLNYLNSLKISLPIV